MVLKLNDRGENVKLLQEKLGLYADGHFGNITKNAVIEFQKSNGLVADGIAGQKTLLALGVIQNEPNGHIQDVEISKFLTEADYLYAANLIGCDVAAIKAVSDVESMGGGFLSNGDVKILFEPHIFYRELKARGINPDKHLAGNSDILYSSWKSGSYGSTNIQWNKMNRAMKINKEAALASASYGRFQIMGFNYKMCKYSSVSDFVNDMMVSERYHLLSLIEFVRAKGLVKHLVNRNWSGFAKGYNGEGYKKNNYDTKLEAAYNKYKRNG